MMLSDTDIRNELSDGNLLLYPYDHTLIQPASIDMTLDDKFLAFDSLNLSIIDPAVEPAMWKPTLARDGSFMLPVDGFALASTREKVSLPNNISGRVEGKSSLGRLGLLTHVTAGFIDPGFTGHITLELKNLSGYPIRLYPGMKIAQLCFFYLNSATTKPYGSTGVGSHYQNQPSGPQASRSHINFTVKEIY